MFQSEGVEGRGGGCGGGGGGGGSIRTKWWIKMGHDCYLNEWGGLGEWEN